MWESKFVKEGRGRGWLRYLLHAIRIDHGCAAGADHQHIASPAADGLIVYVDAGDGVGTEGFGLCHPLLDGDVFRTTELLFVRARSPSNDVADTREQIAEHVGAQDGFPTDKTVIGPDGGVLDRVCGQDEHPYPLSPDRVALAPASIIRRSLQQSMKVKPSSMRFLAPSTSRIGSPTGLPVAFPAAATARMAAS